MQYSKKIISDVVYSILCRMLGMEEYVFSRKARLDRKSVERFIGHIHHLDLAKPTVIEADRSNVPRIRAYQYFSSSNYMYYDWSKGLSLYCLYNPQRVESRILLQRLSGFKNGKTFDRLCREYGFQRPYVLFVEASALIDAAEASSIGDSLQYCTVVLIYMEKENAENICDMAPALEEILRKDNFSLYDCFELKEEKGVHDALYVFAYAPGQSLLGERIGASDENATISGGSKYDFVAQKSCFILGMGRSGTSMLGGILYQAGYYMGENVYHGRITNPKGFYECMTVNKINESILKENFELERHCRIHDEELKDYVPDHAKDHGWLSIFPAESRLRCHSRVIQDKIREMVSRQPFCFKDPRFSYTLPIWKRYLSGDAVFICVFRDPAKTVNSIIAECGRMSYLSNLTMSRSIAYKIYVNMYRHILNYSNKCKDDFMFIHYDQIVSGSALDELSSRLGVNLTSEFVEASLDRTPGSGTIPQSVRETYQMLCEKAEFS